MKLRTLDLTIYLAALLAQSAQAEYVAQTHSWQKPAIVVAQAGEPMNLTPDVEPNSLGSNDEPRIGADHGNETEVKKWLQNFDLVVVIDRAASKQTLIAYRNLGTPDNVILDTAIKTHVSTGVETRGCHYVKSMTRDADGNVWYTKVKPIYKHTPTGYYIPKNIDADH
jgi:hypothetical protein